MSLSDPDLDARMRRAAEQAVDHFLGAPKFKIGRGKQQLFETSFPFAAHAINQVRAALLLIDHGYAFPAEVNARSALEHAVTVQWMILTHDGRKAVAAELIRDFSAVVEDAKHFAELPDDLIVRAPDGYKSDGPARSFEKMCRRFDHSRSLYVMYRRLSGSVHPSLSSVSQYLDHGDETVTLLRLEPDPIPDVDLMWACGLAAVFAVSALETLRHSRPYKAKIRGIASEAGMPPDLSGSDTQPELRRAARRES
jgi:hypothetical protein